jgi:polyferredoxin
VSEGGNGKQESFTWSIDSAILHRKISFYLLGFVAHLLASWINLPIDPICLLHPLEKECGWAILLSIQILYSVFYLVNHQNKNQVFTGINSLNRIRSPYG